jgi:hypothetical protein
MSTEIPADNGAEERIATLEKRVRDMEALVRGLTAELLDLRAIARTMARQDGNRGPQDQKPGTIVRGTTPLPPAELPETPSAAVPAGDRTVIRPKGAGQPDVPDTPAEPAMVRIMQSDGTMKMEPRRGGRKTI